MAINGGPILRPLGPCILLGQFVELEPFRPEHREELYRAAGPHTFRYFPTPDFDSWYAKALKDDPAGRHCFTVRSSRGEVLGSTSYFDMSERDSRVEIGSTWYTEKACNSAVNPEAKLLLLDNAFAAGFHSVVLKTCSRNGRSRAAILKLGAKEDGILRAAVWMPASAEREGYFRDSVFYSILADEWPDVRAGLEARLADRF